MRLVIAQMKAGERTRMSPVLDGPTVAVTCEVMGNGHLTYTVNGINVGNVNGAVSAFAVAFAPSLQAGVDNAPLHRQDGETVSNDYYSRLRAKLYAANEKAA